MPAPTDEISRLLAAHRGGDPEAMRQLVPLVYADLQRLARRQLGGSRPGATLDTTSLVHEAYLRLADQKRTGYQNRGHFFAVAAIAMRQIVIDYARHCSAAKRGGSQPIESLEGVQIAVQEQAETLLLLDEALEKLAELDERLIRVVECRFFAGLTADETAEALGVSTRTVERDWKRARAWLRHDMDGSSADPPSDDSEG